VVLFVCGPVTALKLLRFRTHGEIARFQAECGAHILHDAAQTLTAAGVACQEAYREGDIVEQIGDVAEQLGCEAIVLPLPHARIAKLRSLEVVRDVIKRAKGVPVVTADAERIAEKAWTSGCRVGGKQCCTQSHNGARYVAGSFVSGSGGFCSPVPEPMLTRRRVGAGNDCRRVTLSSVVQAIQVLSCYGIRSKITLIGSLPLWLR